MTPTDDEISAAEARARLWRAMENVQCAQNELDRACSELFHVAGASPTERRIFRVRERVHALWYVLEDIARGNKVHKWRLDGMVGPRFIAEVRKANVDDQRGTA